MHYTGARFDYLVGSSRDWDFRDEHPRFISNCKERIDRNDVLRATRPLGAIDAIEAWEHFTLEPHDDTFELQTPSPDVIDLTSQDASSNGQVNNLNQYPGISFEESMKKEMKGFMEQEVFCKPYPKIPAVPAVWLHTVKADGTPKSRLVVLGNRWSSTSPTRTSPPSIEQLVVFLAALSQSEWPCVQVDISTAFLHAPIDEPVNVILPKQLPDGFPYRGVVGLKKAVYGLAQSPLLFEQHLHSVLTGVGFKCLHPGLYRRGESSIFAYVDDLLVWGPDSQELLNELRGLLTIGKCQDFAYGSSIRFLGADITRYEHSVSISVHKYAQDHVDSSIRGAITPSSLVCNPEQEPSWDLLPTIQAKLGILGWIGRFVPKASVQHSILASAAVKHPCRKMVEAIQRFINEYGTVDHVRWLRGPVNGTLFLYSDASFNYNQLESRSGVVIAIGDQATVENPPCVLLTKTKKVKRKVKSAYEAELEAALQLTEVFEKHRRYLNDLMSPARYLYILDSQALYNSLKSASTEDPFCSARLKLLIQRLSELNIPFEWRPREFQLADQMTKV